MDSTDLIDDTRRVFALTIAYDGTRYAGWQSQINAVSIQQRVQEAVAKALGNEHVVVGSGRTDSGVHAISQIARLATNCWRHPAAKLVPAINTRLPSDIVVQSAREVRNDFDPIRNAIAKRYRYTMRLADFSCPFRGRFQWHFPRAIDVPSMQYAARHLIGCHDFIAFQSAGSPRKTTVRTVRELSLITSESDPTAEVSGLELTIEIEADGFLYNMVRNIVGALVEVGTGRFSDRWILDLLVSKRRPKSTITAPPQGLCLIDVKYPSKIWL